MTAEKGLGGSAQAVSTGCPEAEAGSWPRPRSTCNRRQPLAAQKIALEVVRQHPAQRQEPVCWHVNQPVCRISPPILRSSRRPREGETLACLSDPYARQARREVPTFQATTSTQEIPSPCAQKIQDLCAASTAVAEKLRHRRPSRLCVGVRSRIFARWMTSL